MGETRESLFVLIMYVIVCAPAVALCIPQWNLIGRKIMTDCDLEDVAALQMWTCNAVMLIIITLYTKLFGVNVTHIYIMW